MIGRMAGLSPDLRSLIETDLMLLRAMLQLDNAVKLLDEQVTRLMACSAVSDVERKGGA